MFALIYSNKNDNVKQYKANKYYLVNGIIKNHNVVINGKNFYGQPIDSDIKRYEEIRKLTGQDKDYATGCFLDYNFI